MNLKDDEKQAIGLVADLIMPALVRRKTEGVELERHSRNFWNKLRKRLPEDDVKMIQEQPEDAASKTKFEEGLGNLMGAQNIKMSVVAYLYNNGVEL